MRTFRVVFFFAVVVFAAVGCATFCTLMYVPDGVAVTLSSTSGWAAGHYRFEAANLICEVTLPCDPTTQRLTACSQAADGGTTSIMGSLEVDGAGTGLTSLRLFDLGPSTPTTLEVRVLRSDVEVTRQTLTPTYTESEPNGPGCGITRTGTATLAL